MGDIETASSKDECTDMDFVTDECKCFICLSTFTGQAVASPDHCEHHFCLECILEWVKNSNTCPVDRKEFNTLYKRKRFGGKIQNVIKVPVRQNLTEEDTDSDEWTVCEECGRSDRRHLMLLCSVCESGHHITCLSPQLTAVPSQPWICQECLDSETSENNSEAEIYEDEVTDLLADVVPTSCRLRPSSARHPQTNRRTSERIRSQASRDSVRLSRSDQHVPLYLLRSSWPTHEEETGGRSIADASGSRQKPSTSKRRRT